MPAKKQFETIDEYIKTFPKDVQSILEKMRQTIRRAAPEAEETIIYQMYLHTRVLRVISNSRSINRSPTIL